MRKLISSLCVVNLVFGTFSALGQSEKTYAKLQIKSDLVIHPSQIQQLFEISSKRISQSNSWSMSKMDFTKPYRTSWTDVTAKGPFDLQVDTKNISAQEISFTLSWDNPEIAVGEFKIDDTVERIVGGARIIVRLNGGCNGLKFAMPAAQWRVNGKMVWSWQNGEPVVSWVTFDFQKSDSSAPQINLGACYGPQLIEDSLREAIDAFSRDRNELGRLLREGLMDWMQSNLVGLKSELLQPQKFELKKGLSLSWTPALVAGLDKGLIQVSGAFELSKANKQESLAVIERSYDEKTILAVRDSGFILPQNTLPEVVSFLHAQRELKLRVDSNQIESFANLLNSRFLQFFVWPDLFNFSKQSNFYFDITSTAAPKVTNGKMQKEGGLTYSINTPLLVNQWAPNPAQNKYVPYVDFQSLLSGQISAKVDGSDLKFSIQPDPMQVQAQFRPEMMKLRSVNPWIATTLLGSRLQGYLEEKKFSVKLPSFSLPGSIQLGIQDVQIWKKSLRVPLKISEPSSAPSGSP